MLISSLEMIFYRINLVDTSFINQLENIFMNNHTPCITQDLDTSITEKKYCSCEKMSNPDEVVVELARSTGALFQYHKQKHKFLLHTKGYVHEFDSPLCFWCNQEIYVL